MNKARYKSATSTLLYAKDKQELKTLETFSIAAFERLKAADQELTYTQTTNQELLLKLNYI